MMTTRNPTDQALHRPRISYPTYLQYAASRHPQYARLQTLQRDFDEKASQPTSARQPTYGEVMVLDLHQGHYRLTYRTPLSSNGVPIGKSSNRMLEDIHGLLTGVSSNVRVLLHTYHYPSDQSKDGPGINHALLSNMFSKYSVSPHVLLPHFNDRECTGFFKRNQLHLQAHGLRISAQICMDERDPAVKIVFILLGEILNQDDSPHDLNDSEAWPVESVDLGLDDLFFSSIGSSRAWNLKSRAGCYLFLLQNTLFDDAHGLRQDPFEVMIPAIRIVMIMMYNDHLSGWSSNIGIIRLCFSADATQAAKTNGKNTKTIFQDKIPEIIDQQQQSLWTHDLNSVVQYMFQDRNSQAQRDIINEVAAITTLQDKDSAIVPEILSIAASLSSLEESRLSVCQNASVKRLTQLALVVVPISLITSIFGMNIDVLTRDGAKWWTVIIGIIIIYAMLALPLIAMYWRKNDRRATELWNMRTKLLNRLHFVIEKLQRPHLGWTSRRNADQELARYS